ncbi:hypothetical protein BKP45_05665 [Anaerobacillus alkalidiazotrophicus]|uniref:Nucleotidase n=1 Tax=Anaerobacillus alkalidiazotrophicus TaxID=472963 RepID=A0A1S2MBL1_9BACI|nr:hypothetical protein [Anaerobacillus alkalidiazotrophicus]OIJ22162.1 hypothetical protein BKP45_05665 [Anaerobacillus alkalidiazotrophicus]
MKKQIRFGLDIDGTVTSPETFIPYINKHFNKNITLSDITQYELTPFLNVTDEQFWQWMKEYEPIIYKNAPIASFFAETLRGWQNDHHFTYISARGNHLLEITENWFNKHKIPYHHIELLGQHDKLQTIKKHNIEIFFEDKHDNACDISEECNIPVILLDTPYNQDPIPQQVIRVKDWKEAAVWVNKWINKGEPLS